MSKVRWAALIAAAMVTIGTSVFAMLSDAILVDTVSSSKHWQTVFTNAVSLRWNWATNAARAELAIAGMGGSFTTNFTLTVSNYVWQAFGSSAPSAEDAYALTLTFFNSGNGVVEVQTGRLAVVTGAFGGTAVNPISASAEWSKVRENSVIPYDAAWSPTATNAVSTQLVIAKIGGATQTNAFQNTAGYYGWKIRNSGWGYGTFDLTLTFAGATNVWASEVMRQLDGSLISVH